MICLFSQTGYNGGMSLTAPLSSVLSTGALDIGIVSTMSECTVAQAAEFLNMSERHLNNLLNAGYIAFRQENGERLVLLDSMLEYEQEIERRHESLNRMIRWNQEMGLYDD